MEFKDEAESYGGHGPPVAAFTDLPTDIAQLIVYTAVHGASTSATSRALTLVSKEIQYWVDPFFFRHVEFHTSKTFNAYIDSLNDATSSKRLNRIRPFVWSLCIGIVVAETQHFTQLLAIHPSLWSIYLCYSLPQLPPGSLTSLPSGLTHLSASFDQGIETFSTPLFANLTHLDVSDFDLINKRLPDMISLPLLQVIAIGGQDADYGAFQDAVLGLPAHLKTIIWFVNLESISSFLAMDATIKDIVMGIGDPRIVVCLAGLEEEEELDLHEEISPHIIVGDLMSKPFDFFNWRCEGTTLWERAESVKEGRLKRKLLSQ
ncbi:hypothetical protein DL96DRAFT_1628624 [Flagelloscypha sp. PMI_526]|nr:hypothetical protein DL96DRAFT_1628624 [Flagelloscypha sp. PMI_526]